MSYWRSEHKLKYDSYQLHFSILWYILQGQWLMFISFLHFSWGGRGLLMSICDYMRLEMEDEVWKWSDLWESHSLKKINITFLEIVFLSASARYIFPSPIRTLLCVPSTDEKSVIFTIVWSYMWRRVNYRTKRTIQTNFSINLTADVSSFNVFNLHVALCFSARWVLNIAYREYVLPKYNLVNSPSACAPPGICLSILIQSDRTKMTPCTLLSHKVLCVTHYATARCLHKLCR